MRFGSGIDWAAPLPHTPPLANGLSGRNKAPDFGPPPRAPNTSTFELLSCEPTSKWITAQSFVANVVLSPFSSLARVLRQSILLRVEACRQQGQLGN